MCYQKVYNEEKNLEGKEDILIFFSSFFVIRYRIRIFLLDPDQTNLSKTDLGPNLDLNAENADQLTPYYPM